MVSVFPTVNCRFSVIRASLRLLTGRGESKMQHDSCSERTLSDRSQELSGGGDWGLSKEASTHTLCRGGSVGRHGGDPEGERDKNPESKNAGAQGSLMCDSAEARPVDWRATADLAAYAGYLQQRASLSLKTQSQRSWKEASACSLGWCMPC